MTGELAALGLSFIAGVFALAAVIFANDAADAFWKWDARRRETKIKAETKTRTWAETWAGTREGAARAQASIDNGECRVTIAALHRKPKNESRLADFKRSTRRSA